MSAAEVTAQQQAEDSRIARNQLHLDHLTERRHAELAVAPRLQPKERLAPPSSAEAQDSRSGAAVRLMSPTGDFVAGQTALGAVAVPIPAVAKVQRRSIIVRNTSGGDVYLGGAAVTAANGFILKSGESETFDLGDQAILYGITAGGALIVSQMELGL